MVSLPQRRSRRTEDVTETSTAPGTDLAPRPSQDMAPRPAGTDIVPRPGRRGLVVEPALVRGTADAAVGPRGDGEQVALQTAVGIPLKNGRTALQLWVRVARRGAEDLPATLAAPVADDEAEAIVALGLAGGRLTVSGEETGIRFVSKWVPVRERVKKDRAARTATDAGGSDGSVRPALPPGPRAEDATAAGAARTTTSSRRADRKAARRRGATAEAPEPLLLTAVPVDDGAVLLLPPGAHMVDGRGVPMLPRQSLPLGADGMPVLPPGARLVDAHGRPLEPAPTDPADGADAFAPSPGTGARADAAPGSAAGLPVGTGPRASDPPWGTEPTALDPAPAATEDRPGLVRTTWSTPEPDPGRETRVEVASTAGPALDAGSADGTIEGHPQGEDRRTPAHGRPCDTDSAGQVPDAVSTSQALDAGTAGQALEVRPTDGTLEARTAGEVVPARTEARVKGAWQVSVGVRLRPSAGKDPEAALAVRVQDAGAAVRVTRKPSGK